MVCSPLIREYYFRPSQEENQRAYVHANMLNILPQLEIRHSRLHRPQHRQNDQTPCNGGHILHYGAHTTLSTDELTWSNIIMIMNT